MSTATVYKIVATGELEHVRVGNSMRIPRAMLGGGEGARRAALMFVRLKRGGLWWANLGEHRALEQTGRRPVVVGQSDALSRALKSVATPHAASDGRS